MSASSLVKKIALFSGIGVLALIVVIFVTALFIDPADVPEHTIIYEDRNSGRISVEVLVPERYTADQFREIGSHIRYTNGRSSTERLFVTYILPGMQRNGGAYATTHYNPDLEVQVMDWMLAGNPPIEDPEHARQAYEEAKAAN